MWFELAKVRTRNIPVARAIIVGVAVLSTHALHMGVVSVLVRVPMSGVVDSLTQFLSRIYQWL